MRATSTAHMRRRGSAPTPLVQPKRARWVLRAASAANRSTVAASSSLSRTRDATIPRCFAVRSGHGFRPAALTISPPRHPGDLGVGRPKPGCIPRIWGDWNAARGRYGGGAGGDHCR